MGGERLEGVETEMAKLDEGKRGVRKKVRFRHRVRLCFETKEGREGLRRVVEGV